MFRLTKIPLSHSKLCFFKVPRFHQVTSILLSTSVSSLNGHNNFKYEKDGYFPRNNQDIGNFKDNNKSYGYKASSKSNLISKNPSLSDLNDSAEFQNNPIPISQKNNDEGIFSKKKKELDPYLLVEKFDRLLKRGEFKEAIDLPNKYSNSSQSSVLWNKIIKIHSISGDKNKAMKAFHDMKKRSFVPNEQTFTALLVAFSRSNSNLAVQEAKEIYDKIPKYLEKQTVFHTNALMLVYAKNNLTMAMEELYQSMPKTGPDAPDLITYSTILRYHKHKLDDDVRYRLAQFGFDNNSNSSSKFKSDHLIYNVEDKKHLLINRKKSIDKNRNSVRDPKDRNNQLDPNDEGSNPEDIFITMLNVWDDFREDMYNRYKEHTEMEEMEITKMDALQTETPPLCFDATMANCMLEAGNKLSLLPKTHKLTRMAIKVVESAYVFVKIQTPGALSPDFNPYASKSDRKNIIDSIPTPLTKIMLNKPEKNGVYLDVFDSNTLGLFLRLCKHNHEFMRAGRIWNYADALKEKGEFEFTLNNYSAYFSVLYSKLISSGIN
ncbi:Pentatricopeptide repeat-containing protein [Smittium mucronatum]|uniref:Pentatricopeptide repeat-containing protein n=1 Tax=Smittium mucronatum TaxID=133383 RepID=A0A1R0GYF9_9FUNG|nr:Pentatricopeptide repeat-containing protein [Smittium mucronatum]